MDGVTPNWTALVMGSLAGGLVAGYFMLQRYDALKRRGAAIEAGLSQLGDEYANEVARQAADQYMADVYGLTPERMAGMSRLSDTLGTIAQGFSL